MSLVKFQTSLESLVSTIFPQPFPWKVISDTSLARDDLTIYVKPSVTRVFALTAEKMISMQGQPKAIVEWLYNRIRERQGQICDELDQSVGRDVRVEGQMPIGKCRYCGAPYGT